MDKELEKYYSDLQEMFLTNGWKELIKIQLRLLLIIITCISERDS